MGTAGREQSGRVSKEVEVLICDSMLGKDGGAQMLSQVLRDCAGMVVANVNLEKHQNECFGAASVV